MTFSFKENIRKFDNDGNFTSLEKENEREEEDSEDGDKNYLIYYGAMSPTNNADAANQKSLSGVLLHFYSQFVFHSLLIL